jgi:hypothetical protein
MTNAGLLLNGTERLHVLNVLPAHNARGSDNLYDF